MLRADQTQLREADAAGGQSLRYCSIRESDVMKLTQKIVRELLRQSALVRITDSSQKSRHVRKVPTAGIAPAFL